MAAHQAHITFSFLIAIFYGFFGLVFLHLAPEPVLLASIILLIAGSLPDIDGGKDAASREFVGFLSAVIPLALLQFFPTLRTGGMTRIALTVIFSYGISRFLISQILINLSTHRGMFHSIPSAIITAEITYLLFGGTRNLDRVYFALAALTGFIAHLLFDAYGNVDIWGKLVGNQKKTVPALKILHPSWGTTFVVYSIMLLLGWFIAKDYFPQLRYSISALK